MQTLSADSFHIQIGRKRYRFPTLQAVSAAYCAARDASGDGASRVPSAKIFDRDGRQIAHISYNGRIWPGESWQPGVAPLFDPYAGLPPLTAAKYFQQRGIEQRT